MRPTTLLVLLICNLLWGSNVIVSKLVVDDLGIPPLFYAFARSAVVVVALSPLLLRVPSRLPLVLAIGLAINGGSFALLFMGLETASPSAVAIVSLSGAPLTVLFAIMFLGERIGWKRGLGILLTLTGVGIAIGSPSAMGAEAGLMLVFASAVIGAIGSVFFKRIDIRAIDMQAWAGVISAMVLLPMSMTFETGQIAAVSAQPLAAGAALLFAGVAVSIGAHTAYFRILQEHDANLVVPFTLLTPLITIALGALITGDEIGWPMILGGTLAMIGVVIIVLRPSTAMFKPLLVRPRL